MIKTIDMSQLPAKAYIGRPNGEAARAKFELDDLDANHDLIIKVNFPADAVSLNSSFFLGMFAKSIIHLGSKEAFLEKYQFGDSYDKFRESIDTGVTRALFNKTLSVKRR